MKPNTQTCQVAVIGAGPYGLATTSYVKAEGLETRTFGDPMSFWRDQMPAGMCLRSNWGASHIADPQQSLTLDAYCREQGIQFGKPIPLEHFVSYGLWYQQKAVPEVEKRYIQLVEPNDNGFKLTLADGELVPCKRVIVAAGINSFVHRPDQFAGLTAELVSHSSEHTDLTKFKGRSVAIIGAGQSALESAALLRESGAEVEVLARQNFLNWVGLHPRLHHLGFLSSLLYSKRDVGPAGISRLVAAPHVFKLLPRNLQNRIAYRAIRPAGAGWLQSRLKEVPITLGSEVVSAVARGNRLCLALSNGSERLVDHALLATGYRVNVSQYSFLSQSLLKRLETANGYPVLKRGLESAVPGLHFVGKPAAWSFGPLLGFVSGAEFASIEVARALSRRKRLPHDEHYSYKTTYTGYRLAPGEDPGSAGSRW